MTYWKFALCAIILLFVIVSWDAVMLHTNVVNDQKKFEKIESGCGHNVSKPCIDEGEGTIEVVKGKADEGNDGIDSVVHELPKIYVDGEAIKEVQADKHKRFHLYLIGERHSGTNWIADQLKGCFPDMKPSTDFARFKHWFQDEHLFKEGQIKPAIVVAMFRNVYDWIYAMNFAPHHSPAHLYMDVDKFLKKPWTMDRPSRDKAIKNKLQTNCLQKYGYNDVVPCIRGSEPPHLNRTRWDRFSGWDPIYELKRDGSGQPYQSIVDLRADKIRNFMNTSNYKNVHAFIPLQYETLVSTGTEELITRISDVSGLQRGLNCSTSKKRQWMTKSVNQTSEDWLNNHVDWSAEALIGYKRRS